MSKFSHYTICSIKVKTREGWPLLTVETEVNRNSKSTNERGPSLVVRWACRAGARDFYPALTTLVSPVQNICFLTINYISLYVCPHRPTTRGQAVVQGRLPLNACLRIQIRNIFFLPCQQKRYCLRVGNVLTNRGVLPPHTQPMTTTILKSSIPSHGIDASKIQFHNGLDA
jgi:hypothetical protein